MPDGARAEQEATRQPWTYDMRCGCTIQTVIDGIAQVSMFDGISGLNVKCPMHGWSVSV